MNQEKPYYSRYDERYRKIRELGLEGFKGKEYVAIDVEDLDTFVRWRPDIKPSSRIIEFGCGDGYLAVHLAKKGFDVTAFDYSEAAIEGCESLARKKKVNVCFRQGDALGIDWAKDASFDLGVSNMAFQMFGTSKDRDQYAKEMLRVLKPGAFLYMKVPATTDSPEEMPSLEDLRKQREFMCDLKGQVEVDGKKQKVVWPQVASWGPNIYTAAALFRSYGFELHYLHWENNPGEYRGGLVMYLRKPESQT